MASLRPLARRHHYYTARTVQLEGLLMASAVRTAWAQFNYAAGSRLSCASDMPQAALVPFGKPSRYLRCDGSSFDTVKINHIPNDGVRGPPFVFSLSSDPPVVRSRSSSGRRWPG